MSYISICVWMTVCIHHCGFYLCLCNGRWIVMGCVVIGRCVVLTHFTGLPSYALAYSLLSGALPDTCTLLHKSWRACENASQSSRCSCSFHASASSSVSKDECVYWWCVIVCVSTREKKKKMKHIQNPFILSTLPQKPFIFLIVTATNLWLHYYRQCFILIPTHRPGGGLVNGEGDGEGDRPVLLLWYLSELAGVSFRVNMMRLQGYCGSHISGCFFTSWWCSHY